MFEEIRSLIEKYPRIILHRHKNPDGDALGAQLGLKDILEKNYPEEKIYVAKDIGDAMNKVNSLATDKKKIVLLENDLPDNY